MDSALPLPLIRPTLVTRLHNAQVIVISPAISSDLNPSRQGFDVEANEVQVDFPAKAHQTGAGT